MDGTLLGFACANLLGEMLGFFGSRTGSRKAETVFRTVKSGVSSGGEA